MQILNKRKGFIKMALQTGASLVPLMAFGETSLLDIEKPAEGSFVDRLQKWVWPQYVLLVLCLL